MLRKTFPHPYMTVLLVFVWLMLNNAVTLGGIVFGLILATIIPLATAAYWPDRPRIHSPFKAAAYVLLVLWDICVANVLVARIVLFMPNARLRPAWVSVPLDLRFLATSRTPLEEEVAAGRFRADLLYRLAVVRLHVPPLSARREDVPLLFLKLLAEAAIRHRVEPAPPPPQRSM